jgi:hypothetical protein
MQKRSFFNGTWFSKGYKEKLKKMMEFSRWTIEPDGLTACISDSDRGEECPVALNIGALLFGSQEDNSQISFILQDKKTLYQVCLDEMNWSLNPENASI